MTYSVLVEIKYNESYFQIARFQRFVIDANLFHFSPSIRTVAFKLSFKNEVYSVNT